MMTPSSLNLCPECGKPVPADSQHQVCPACLMAQALASRTIDGGPSAAPPPTPEEIANKFPQFDILQCLGRGGMGVVYKARQKSLNRLVAIKILPPERVPEARFAERFAREAELLAQLSHTHIVTIHDFGETGGLFYLVMEFVDGVNLRDLLRDGKLEPKHALAIVSPICDALQYAHDKGIVHRDIKPENLLMDREGRIKIADFGIAALVGVSGENAGTPPYMAPEQNGPAPEVDHRADIYALGVVLYEMLTGERPGKELISPSQKVHIDVRLDEVVLRALEKNPALRYQQVSDVKTMVETIAATPPQPQTEVRQPLAEPQGKGVHFSRTAVVGACWAPLAFIVALFFFLAPDQNSVAVGSRQFVPGWWQNLLTFTLMSLCATAPFGTTILGWVAAAQIRRSAGRLYGMGLAVFDGLLFPLLVLDGLIFLAYSMVIRGLRMLPSPPFMDVAVIVIVVVLGLLSIALMVWLDTFISRRVWRAVNMGSAGVAPAEPPSAPAKATRPRVRFEIAGAYLAFIFFIVALLRFAVRHFEGPWPSDVLPFLDLLGTPIALFGAVAATVFGWIAVAQIRRSASPTRGLGLAVFDGLLFPLLVLDGVIGLVSFIFGDFVVERRETLIDILFYGAVDLWAGMVLTIGLMAMAWVDYMIARAVWRAVNKNAAPNIPAIENADTAAFQALEKASRATRSGKWALRFCAGGVALPAWMIALYQPTGVSGWVLVIAVSVICELTALVLGIIGWKSGAGKAAVIVAAMLQFLAVPGLFMISYDPGKASVSVPAMTSLPEIESVVVGADKAVVKQRVFHGEGMIFTFGTMTDHWTVGSAYFDHLFDVNLEWPWFNRHGANWVIKSRHGIYADYLLDGPPGPMHGKIVFHPGTPAPETDGSYVIGEFKSETGVSLPIAVRLVRDSKPTASPAAAAPLPSIVSNATVDSARTNLTSMNARYQAGMADRLDVIEAEQNLHWSEAMSAGDRKAAAIAKRDGAKAKLAVMAEKVKAGVIGQQEMGAVEKELAEAEAALATLEVKEPATPAAVQELSFGPVMNGLQAAVELTTSNGVFRLGEPIGVRFHIRNASDHGIVVAGRAYRQTDHCILDNEQGHRVDVSMRERMIRTFTQRGLVGPGEVMVFESGGLSFGEVKAAYLASYSAKAELGHYTLRFRLHLPDAGSPDKPEPDDWQGELETGAVTLEVKAPATPAAAPVPTTGETTKPSAFRTIPITRGDIAATISCIGTIEPEEVVEVGAQLAGKIVSLGDDPRGVTDLKYRGKTIDYGSPVEAGTVLARIDDAICKARVEKENAACERAKSELALAQAQQETAENAKVSVTVAEATVAQAKAALQEAQANLDHTIIRSPIKGVILARRVNVGQNVAPTSQSPSSFLIAKDLTKVTVWASVNEVDIGPIKKGMEANVTVDAFPGEVFKGNVEQIRLNATMAENVVIYTVVLGGFENQNQKLLPYMTANVQFQIASRRGVLRVPTKALRWKPLPEQMAYDVRPLAPPHKDRENRGLLWVEVQAGKSVRPIEVQVGLSDGEQSEVSGPDVKEGMGVVYGEATTTLPAIQTVATPPSADQVVVEDLALRMLVAIREKDDATLRALATDKLKEWDKALPLFALEMRERFQQHMGKPFEMYPTESFVKGDRAVVKCTGAKEVYLVLYFVRTPDGWRNWMIRNSPLTAPLAKYWDETWEQNAKSDAK